MTTVSDLTIRTAEPGDIDTLAELLSLAVRDLPAARWLLSEPPLRSRILPYYLRIHVRHAVRYGTVHLATLAEHKNPVGVAVWLPGVVALPRDYHRQLDLAIGCLYSGRFAQLDYTLNRAHPDERDHEYLVCAAVTPNQQREGIGAALLAGRHADLDQARRPAYAVAPSPACQDWYQRLGYHSLGQPISLPGRAEPAMWPMWRYPLPINA